MGHYISALVCKPSTEIDRAAEFELTVIRKGEFVLIPLCPEHSDDWTERLGMEYGTSPSGVRLNSPIILHIANILAADDYAIIETNYFGGVGYQAAEVYGKGHTSPLYTSEKESIGPINKALRLLGISASKGMDEFDTFGLRNHRSFEDCFDKYWND